MLAPVLARIDQLPGVAESRVDWEGQHVLIQLEPGSTWEAVVAQAAPILGAGACRLEPSAEADHIASFDRGDRWMRAAETIRLSRHEAGVLGAQLARSSAERANLDEMQIEQLETVLTEEFGSFFEQVHASGTSPDDVTSHQLLALERRIRVRCQAFATAPQANAIIEELRSIIGMCEEQDGSCCRYRPRDDSVQDLGWVALSERVSKSMARKMSRAEADDSQRRSRCARHGELRADRLVPSLTRRACDRWVELPAVEFRNSSHESG